MASRLKYALLSLVVAMTLSPAASAQYDKDVFLYRGRQALSDGKYALAIENFNILSQLDTADHWIWFFRGIAKYNLGDLRGAYGDFDTSVRKNPVFTSGYHYRAITLSRFGRYDEALEDLRTAIGLRPGFIGLYYSRGVTYFLSQQFEKAVGDFDKYIRKEPKDPSAYLNRGASYLFLGDTLKAVTDYNKAIKLDRFDPEGYVRRGRLYASSGDFASAIADMDKAIELDSTNTFAFFNRAIMLYEKRDYMGAMSDLNTVLRHEPGNALTLYNRGLIEAQVGEYEAALGDLDRVLDINPENVLAYFNRASVFVSMERWQDALEDYDRAINLYPDFAKAYMNRSYVNLMLGRNRASKEDYRVAQQKVREYRASTAGDKASFADTTRKYSSLLALDADFARKDFSDELLQHRDIDIRLRPMYRFVAAPDTSEVTYALKQRYENRLVDKFRTDGAVSLAIDSTDPVADPPAYAAFESAVYGDTSGSSRTDFLKALGEGSAKRYNTALSYLDAAIDGARNSSDSIERLYEAFYLMNRGVLRAEIIDFISSIDNSVQVLTMDDAHSTRARVKESVTQQYDWSEAIADLEAASKVVGDIPYIYFDLGNLYCLASDHLQSIENYDKAIGLYPQMADAYFNRGLVLIYLRDREKGCIDLSRAGELGLAGAYPVIKKYCEEEGK